MTDTTALDDALGRIAAMLSGSTPATPTPPSIPGTGSSSATTANPGVVPSTSGGSGLTDSQKSDVAKLIYYCMSVPPITREKLLETEKELPQIVSMFHNLNASPTTRNDLWQLIDVVNSQVNAAERSDGDSSFAAFAESLRAEAFGEGERIIPIIALGVACFMAGYTVSHTWGR